MKSELFNLQTAGMLKTFAGNENAGHISTELEIYKKMLSFFQPGDYFYFIFNIKNFVFDLLSPQVESVLGYAPSAITVPMFMDWVHPEDRPWLVAFETRATSFWTGLSPEKLTKYKVRYDFRMKKKNGSYIRLLHQAGVVEHDNNGGIIRTLGVNTDITHLKKEGKPTMAFIGTDGEPSYHDINVKGKFIDNKKGLTSREKEILILLIEGRPSKQISDILHISKQTVDTHRKNMLHRNNLNNTGELIGRAIKQGWV